MIIKAGPIWIAKVIEKPLWIADDSRAALIDCYSGRLLVHIVVVRGLTFVRFYLPMRRAFRLARQLRCIFGNAVLTLCFPRLELLVEISEGTPLHAAQEWVDAVLRL